jgi:hypothetical protein
MKKIFNLNGFINRNPSLTAVWLMATMAIFSFAPLVQTTLINYFGLTEDKLSFLSTVYIFGFLFASYLNNYFMNNHVNIIKITTYSATLFLLSILGELYLISQDRFAFDLFIIFRSIDAFSGYLLGLTLAHIISTKIITNPLRVKINSLQTTMSYIVKTLAPIAVASLIVFYDNPSFLYITPILLAIIIIITVMMKRKVIFRKYTRVLMIQVGTHKRKTFHEIKAYFDFNVDKWWQRMYYLAANFLHNIVRSNYDLIMPASLLLNYNLDLSQVAIIISMMVLGQAMQFKIHFLIKVIPLEMLYVIHILFHIGLIATFFIIPNLSINELYMIFFLLGTSRSIYGIWHYNYGMDLINKKITIQNQKFINEFVAETGHLLGYVAVMLLMVTPGSYREISVFYAIMLFSLLVLFFIKPKN